MLEMCHYLLLAGLGKSAPFLTCRLKFIPPNTAENSLEEVDLRKKNLGLSIFYLSLHDIHRAMWFKYMQGKNYLAYFLST